MDKARAKFLLQSGFPRAGDRDEPGFVEAQMQADADPTLAAWVNQQQERADALGAKLKEIPVPANLRECILAGGAVSERRTLRSRRTWLALAAGFAGLLAAGWWQWDSARNSNTANLASLRTDMTAFLSGPFKLELYSPSLPALRGHLAQQHKFSNYEVPAKLAAAAGVGCRTVPWRDRQVMLICFTADHQLVHLMILPRAQLSDALATGRVVSKQVGEWATASWADEKNVYLAATLGSAEFLSARL
jgi:hypothetical protein